MDAKEYEEDNENQEDASASAAATIQTLQIAEAVKRIPGRENWQHIDHEIVFETGDVPPLSQKRFSFRRKKIQAQTADPEARFLEEDTVFVTERGSYYYNHEEKQLISYINSQGTVYIYWDSNSL